MADENEEEAEHLSSRFRGTVHGSIIRRVGMGEKIFFAAFFGMVTIIVGLLTFICIAVWDGNREGGELQSAFREYAAATNRRLDALERMLERVLLERNNE